MDNTVEMGFTLLYLTVRMSSKTAQKYNLLFNNGNLDNKKYLIISNRGLWAAAFFVLLWPEYYIN